jgi:X-X-X-Leu-X-X-Gly heptad repeat protein
VRAAGRVEIDERRVHTVSAKFEGWIERLHVNATGQPVGRGQPLFEVYSPELVSAQREYTVAAKGVAALKDASAEMQSGMKQLADASLARLRNWDISEEQIKALAGGGEAKRTLSFRPRGRRGAGKEGGGRHALHARRNALPDRRHFRRLGAGRRLRARHRAGESRRRRSR